MSIIRALTACLFVVGLAAAPAPATAAADPSTHATLAAPAAATSGGRDLTIDITPSAPEIALGAAVDLTVTATNTGSTGSGPIALHLDVTDVAANASVDPEDWTKTLTRRIGVLGAGEARSLIWRVQPISGGTFTLYVVALDADGTTAEVAVSDTVTVQVATRTSLNPQGVLPVVLLVPGAIALLLVSAVRRRRATGSAGAAQGRPTAPSKT